MSNFNNSDFEARTTGALRPEHHIHESSDPLPGTAGSDPTVGYGTSDTMNPTVGYGTSDTTSPSRSRFGGQAQDQLGEYGQSGMPEISTSHDRPVHVGYGDQGDQGYDTARRDIGASGIGREQMDRPLGVQPVREGGVAVGGRENEELPMGKATAGDKIIGKTQKVAGKLTHNPEMHEKGELREAGGRSAVTGSARAPHD